MKSDTLSQKDAGDAGTYAEKFAAEDAARRVAGVRAIVGLLKATLRGNAHSREERDAAGIAAWCAPGVSAAVRELVSVYRSKRRVPCL